MNVMRRAFSLIELLVVIAIIGVLVALLLPALSGAADRARQAKCMAHGQQAALALSAYAGDNRSVLPTVPVPAGLPVVANQHRYGGLAGFFSLQQQGDGTNVGFTGGAYSNGSDIPVLRSYFSHTGVLRCPSDKEDRYYGMPHGPGGNTSYAAARAMRPEAPGREEDVVSYNISYVYFTGRTLTSLRVEAVWADETNGPDIDDLAWYGPGYPGQATVNSAAAGAAGAGWYAPVDNHRAEGGHIAATDGSVRWHKSDRPLSWREPLSCVD
ncbi:MAG: type II secretion system protein [Phycisphaeraceae bacterium]|nr:type II secretion system protein [Phycisphaeraceae bacterium]